MMSVLTFSWAMITTACAMLGLTQAFLWWNSGRKKVHLLAMVMAFSAIAVSILELSLSRAPDPEQHERLLVWLNLAVALVLVPMVWSIKAYLPNARRWMAILITALWSAGIAVNFLLPGNLTFSEVLAVDRFEPNWGDSYFLARGTVNNWKWLADITVLMIPVYVIDAAWQARHDMRSRQGWVIAVGVVLFVIIAGSQAILIDVGLYQAPVAISLAFLFVIIAMTWVHAEDAVRAGKLDEHLADARRETERLMRANLMGEVAATLAHEINQPLAAILGNAQAGKKFLAQPDPDLGEIREILDDIVRDDKRARDIITNLRTMLRGDQSEIQQVDLEQSVQEILRFMDHELQRQSIDIKVDIGEGVPRVCGGQVAIQQVIMNLILNAAHAISGANTSRREITIRVLEKQEGAEIEVRDFGPGIADEVQQRLFEPFVTTKEGSLGMGLVVSRRLVENQGGRITAENVKSGGARFRIWLPACRL